MLLYFQGAKQICFLLTHSSVHREWNILERNYLGIIKLVVLGENW